MWVQKIRNRKLQMFLIGLIVAVSSFMLSSAIGIIQNTKKPMDDLIKRTGSPLVSLNINQSSEENQEYENIKKYFQDNHKVNHIKTIENVNWNIGDLKINGKPVETKNYFLKYNDGDFGEVSFTNGAGVLEKDECYVSSSLAEVYKLSIGDYIVTNGSKGEKKFKVKDIYTEPYTASFAILLQRIYVNESDLEYIDSVKTNIINIFGEKDIVSKDIVRDLGENYDNKFPVLIIDLDICKLSAEVSSKVIGGFIGAFALIILLVSAIVIRASVYDSLIKEYKTIGVYKAIGFNHIKIMGIYIKAYISVIMLALIVAISCSKGFIKFILNKSFKGYDYDGNVNMIWPALITVMFVIVIILGCIFTVIYKTKKIYPVDALTKGMPSNERSIKGMAKLENNFSPLAISIRRMFNYKKLTILLLLVLFICSYSMIFAITNYSNITKLSQKGSFWFGVDDGELRISIKNKDKLEEIENWVKNNPNTVSEARANVIYEGIEFSKQDKIYNNKNLISCIYNEFDNGLKIETIEGRNPRYENEISLNKLILEKGKKSIGDYITLYVNGEKKNFLITGSHQSMINIGFNVRILESVVKKYDKNYVVDSISVKVKDRNNLEQFKKEINNNFGQWVEVKEDKEYLQDTLKSVMEPQKSALGPFIGVVIAIGAINVFAVITLININNKRSFSIYKALGFSSGDLIISNGLYVLTLSIISAILSIPAFIFTFGEIMNGGMKYFGIYNYPANYDIKLIIFILIVSIFVYTLSSALSSLSIKKLCVAEINEE